MYLVCYDISLDRLRKKVSDKLLNYGKRVQYSVFECDINEKQYKKMYATLVEVTQNMKEGNVRIYYLNKDSMDKVVTIGDPSFVSEELKEECIFI